MAAISGLAPCLDFIEVILVVSCSFYCSNFVSSFFSSVGFCMRAEVPWRKTRYLQTTHGQFGTLLAVLSSAH